MKKLKIALCQTNPCVGDIEGNCQNIISNYLEAEKQNCHLIVFPEMAICGYDCKDLLLKSFFLEEIKEKTLKICQTTLNKNCAILFGSPSTAINRSGKEITHNSAILIENGEVKDIANKKSLPNKEVFDEKRYFEESKYLSYPSLKGFTLNILICEDMWSNINATLASQQIFDFSVSINASPFQKGKAQARLEKAKSFVKETNKPLIYCNLFGGQDELVFDGNSFVINQSQEEILSLKYFQEDFQILEITKEDHQITVSSSSNNQQPNCINQSIYQASVLGLRDYVKKNNFQKILLGMSGGIDSAIAATIATDALGSENVGIYALPTKFNSQESLNDAEECAENLNLSLKIIEIEDIFQNMLKILGNINEIAKQNLQSRIRGNVLMSISNDTGALLLSTGNKSELAVGYATIYGDMCGAFNPLKDIYKTEIFELANWRNNNIPEISLYKEKNLIPQNIITKEPSAELAPDQKDSDSLPKYKTLDKILNLLIEEQKSIAEIVSSGFDTDEVKKIAKLFYSSQYKRSQSPIGPKISKMAFGIERRYPITNKYCK